MPGCARRATVQHRLDPTLGDRLFVGAGLGALGASGCGDDVVPSECSRRIGKWRDDGAEFARGTPAGSSPVLTLYRWQWSNSEAEIDS